MNIVFLTTLIIGLILIAYQDLKFRKIHVALPVLIFMMAILKSIYSYGEVNKDMDLIYGFIILNFFVIFIYLSIKEKRWVNPFKKHIGLGDFLFLLAIVPLFNLRPYIIFFIMGMVFSLVLYRIFRARSNYNNIPLAGYFSILLLVLIMVNMGLTTCDLFKNFILYPCN